jgi:hypothetical protein
MPVVHAAHNSCYAAHRRAGFGSGRASFSGPDTIIVKTDFSLSPIGSACGPFQSGQTAGRDAQTPSKPMPVSCASED